ncbi:MAG: hypothetical protein FWH20_00115 [Oscillospiraceae bacterium]|nr:hypothetical protein [Oscillospiraceae bacterium]
MKKDLKHLSFRINPDLLGKFGYVSNYENRSMNGALIKLVTDYVAEFEEQHGKIALEFEEDEGVLV